MVCHTGVRRAGGRDGAPDAEKDSTGHFNGMLYSPEGEKKEIQGHMASGGGDPVSGLCVCRNRGAGGIVSPAQNRGSADKASAGGDVFLSTFHGGGGNDPGDRG